MHSVIWSYKFHDTTPDSFTGFKMISQSVLAMIVNWFSLHGVFVVDVASCRIAFRERVIVFRVELKTKDTAVLAD